jgi:hypothetical protein
MKKFNVWGKFIVDVDFNIDAKSEKDAEKKAKEMIKNEYHLDAIGGIHVAKSTDFKLLIDEED